MESKVTYLNDKNEVVSQENATKAIITRYDENGNIIDETFGTLSNDQSPYEFEDDSVSYEEKMRLFDDPEDFPRR